jgi:hypothetical protein
MPHKSGNKAEIPPNKPTKRKKKAPDRLLARFHLERCARQLREALNTEGVFGDGSSVDYVVTAIESYLANEWDTLDQAIGFTRKGPKTASSTQLDIAMRAFTLVCAGKSDKDILDIVANEFRQGLDRRDLKRIVERNLGQITKRLRDRLAERPPKPRLERLAEEAERIKAEAEAAPPEEMERIAAEFLRLEAARSKQHRD